jgi:hypothetical protein
MKEKTAPDGSKGYHIKTIKLKGTFSQGLITELNSINIDLSNFKDGDLTSILEVRKYEDIVKPYISHPNSMTKNDKPLPDFIPRTEQERIQNLTDQ